MSGYPNERQLAWPAFSNEPFGKGVTFVTLQPMGWHALMAYLIGKPFVRQIAHEYQPIVTRCSDGSISYSMPSNEDKDDIHMYMVSYLADFGIPSPPKSVGWQLQLPAGTSFHEIQTAINSLIDEFTNAQGKLSPLDFRKKAKLKLSAQYQSQE
jgi:hypothetical protein